MFQTWIDVRRRIIFQNSPGSLEPSLSCFIELPFLSFYTDTCELRLVFKLDWFSKRDLMEFKTKLT